MLDRDRAPLKGGRAAVDLESCAQGDKAAWDRFVEASAPLIGATIRKVWQVHGRGAGGLEAEDAVQEVYLRLLKNDFKLLKSYDSTRASPPVWLAVVARSTALDCLRRKEPSSCTLNCIGGQSAPTTPDERDPLEVPEGLLTPRQKLILFLLFDRGWEVPEVAEFLKIDTQTVRSMKHKALSKLRGHFGGDVSATALV